MFLEKSKKLNAMNEPLHPSTNPEILVKICLLVSEPPGLKSRPLKTIKKNIDKIYSPFGKYAEWAKQTTIND